MTVFINRVEHSGGHQRHSIGLRSCSLIAALTATACTIVGAAQQTAAVPSESRRREYAADVPKSMFELQQFRESQSIRIRATAGRQGVATLVNLNPSVNVWYVLEVDWQDRTPTRAYHLENPHPHDQTLLLDEKYPIGLAVVRGAQRYSCELFSAASRDALEQGRGSRQIYYPLCESRVYLRNAVAGHHTALEAATEFLRNRVWGGEQAIALGHHLLADVHRETGQIVTDAQAAARGRAQRRPGPTPALIDAMFADRMVTAPTLGISLEDPPVDGLVPGAWYPVTANSGIYVSVLQPNFIAQEILQQRDSAATSLDRVEASALCYLIAFDLDLFALGYAGGTDHPRVGWSDHILPQMKNPALPGPDGIGSIAPLSATGLVSPENARRTVAVFTGGFKRTHGAFKQGELGRNNHGSHYGFVENGVVLSKLQPGLATLLTLNDGSIEMKTWEEADNARLARVRHARQNGVPLVEFDETSQSSAAGRLVGQWGPGNWSGSEDLKLRTIRAGAAVQSSVGKRFLIYAVFSAATPSAMARVFQAYRARYAMLLDMNALEHTYLAVYRRSGPDVAIEHLIKGMSVLDQSAAGQRVPRFVGYPDNRDFFYLMRRDTQGVQP